MSRGPYCRGHGYNESHTTVHTPHRLSSRAPVILNHLELELKQKRAARPNTQQVRNDPAVTRAAAGRATRLKLLTGLARVGWDVSRRGRAGRRGGGIVAAISASAALTPQQRPRTRSNSSDKSQPQP